MIRTTLHDIVPLVDIGEAWVSGLDPTVPQFVDQSRGRAFWATDRRATPFYKVIRASSLDLAEEVSEPTCIVEWPSGRHALYLPDVKPRPYQNRQHVTGTDDCYTLAREWYWRERQILLPTFKADRELMLSGNFDLFDTHPAARQWERMIVPQIGDAVLFKFGEAKSPNHCGVVLEDGWFLHHFYDRLSTIEKLDGVWRANVCEFRRHKGV